MKYWFLNFPNERQALHDINIGSWYHDYESGWDFRKFCFVCQIEIKHQTVIKNTLHRKLIYNDASLAQILFITCIFIRTLFTCFGGVFSGRTKQNVTVAKTRRLYEPMIIREDDRNPKLINYIGHCK